MEEYVPWLTCRMGRQLYLLAKDVKAYYLIEVGKNLDYATEECLQQRGVSEELLKELKLPFIYIPKTTLRGATFSGHEAGDYVYLYLKSEKKKLMLELDYDLACMEDFFADIQRFAAPKTKKTGDNGWRKERQDKELYKRCRFVPAAFLIVGMAVSIGYVVTGNWIFFTLTLLCIAAQIGLAMALPVYFTIHLPKGAKKQNVLNFEFPLIVITLIVFLRSRLNWMSYEALWYLLPSGAALGALVYWRIVDLHQENGRLLSSLILGAFVAVILAGQINEVYDFTPPESYILQVEDLYTTSGKNRRHYCTVTMPDGREVDISVPRTLYRELDEGDFVQVEHDIGVLGIEYVRVVSEE